MLRSLTVSVEPINETEGFPEHSRIAITSASVHSSPSVVDSRTNSRLTESLGDGEGLEPSTENGLGLPSLHWQSDSPSKWFAFFDLWAFYIVGCSSGRSLQDHLQSLKKSVSLMTSGPSLLYHTIAFLSLDADKCHARDENTKTWRA